MADRVEEEDNPEDGFYSDGSNFERTQKIVGYQPKVGSSSDPYAEDGEYQDVFKVVKTLKDDSDNEPLQCNSDNEPPA